MKINYETAADLGIDEFTQHTRKLSSYRDYAILKARRKWQSNKMWQLWIKSGNDPYLHKLYNLHFRFCAKRRNAFWRAQGYPNLRKAWASRRRNAAIARERKAEEARREYWRRYWERYGC